MLLGEHLICMDKISEAQLQAALEQQRSMREPVRIGEALVGQGAITEEDLMQALGEQFGLHVVEQPRDEMLDPELIENVPVEWARSRNLLPIRYDNQLAVLISDPTHVTDQDDVALLLNEEPLPVLASPTTIAQSIERCYYNRKETARAFIEELDEGESIAAVRARGERGPAAVNG